MRHASFQIEHESDRPLAMFAASILSEVRDPVLVQKPRPCADSSVQRGRSSHACSVSVRHGRRYASFFRFPART
jgi:hypothetical protein